MSEVAHVRVRRIAVYRSPRAKHASLVLRRSDENGTQRAFLVRATKGDWVRVFLPTRPNGSQGWVRRRALRVYTNGYRLVIRLRSHQLRLWRGGASEAEQSERHVRPVLVRTVGALERAEAIRRR